jgi:hypothetical protein
VKNYGKGKVGWLVGIKSARHASYLGAACAATRTAPDSPGWTLSGVPAPVKSTSQSASSLLLQTTGSRKWPHAVRPTEACAYCHRPRTPAGTEMRASRRASFHSSKVGVMACPPAETVLSAEERGELERRAACYTLPHKVVQRAKLAL